MFENEWLLISVGLLLIGLGGVLGTLGWNKYHIHSQKNNIIDSVKRECISNKNMIHEALETIRQNNATSRGFSYRPYKSTQVNVFLTSGLFYFRGSEASTIREAFEQYEQEIDHFNAALRIVGRHNPGLFLKPEFVHNRAKVMEVEIDSALSEKFFRLKIANEKVLKILSQKRKWSKF